MIWGETTTQRKDRLEVWHDWYAWYPVKLMNGRWAWFSDIYRLQVTGALGGTFFIYRERPVCTDYVGP